ncbi:hypothetical protein IWX49DRAFT_625930 [Phyllosticta citricarpa]
MAVRKASTCRNKTFQVVSVLPCSLISQRASKTPSAGVSNNQVFERMSIEHTDTFQLALLGNVVELKGRFIEQAAAHMHRHGAAALDQAQKVFHREVWSTVSLGFGFKMEEIAHLRSMASRGIFEVEVVGSLEDPRTRGKKIGGCRRLKTAGVRWLKKRSQTPAPNKAAKTKHATDGGPPALTQTLIEHAQSTNDDPNQTPQNKNLDPDSIGTIITLPQNSPSRRHHTPNSSSSSSDDSLHLPIKT